MRQDLDDIASDPALFDGAVLDGLRAVFGERTAVLLDRTRSVLDERARDLGPAAAGGDVERVARLAHEIGGMAGQIGLSRLAQHARALEALCHDGAGAGAVGAAAAALGALAGASLEALPRD